MSKRSFFRRAYAALYMRKLIRRQSMPAAMKKRIFDTYLSTVAGGKVDKKNDTLRLLGYELKFCEFGHYEFLLEELFVNQEYAFETKESAPLIIDCGSNIGMSIIYFKDRFPNSEIIAFEPDDSAWECLQHNVSANGFENVSAHKKALSADGRDLSFTIDDDGDGSLTSSAFATEGTRTVTIPSTQLSPFIDRDVDFLKMDIEGGETEVMQELSDAGVLSRVKQMSIEYHHHCYDDEDCMSVILGLLEKNGLGYQIEGKVSRPFKRRKPQGMIIYAYRKSD